MISILVPVLGRPQNVRPLVENVATTTLVQHELIFLVSPGDHAEREACEQTEATVLVVDWEPDRGDFAKKINYGYRKSKGEFLFLGADDLRFQPSWDIEAIRVADETGAGVIGTNDLGNPAVYRKQEFATHPLVRRSYIEEQGGSLDGPGTVYHEGYDHNFVDRELWDLAKYRHQVAFAINSRIEHLHPHWGKGRDDPTYEKALRDFFNDQRRYWSRCEQWGKTIRPGEQRELRNWLRKQQVQA